MTSTGATQDTLATKADLGRLRSDLNRNMVATVGIATAIILGAMRLWL